MRRDGGFVLLLLGIAMVVFGLDSDRTFASSLIAELKAQPHFRSSLLLLGGILLGIVGFAMVFGGGPREPKSRDRDD